MENHKTVTVFRLYLPATSHSVRKTQIEKVINLLRDQLDVHGLTVLPVMNDTGASQGLHYRTVGDVLRRNPDPPLIVEFFDDSLAATQIIRAVRELVPNSYALSWEANWESALTTSA
jgi:PII-like signaling protein